MRPCVVMIFLVSGVLVASTGFASEGIEIMLPGLEAGTRPMRFVLIPAGAFIMGSPDSERGRWQDEGPAHEVSIENPFYLAETEVTQAQWLAVMGQWPGPSPDTVYGKGSGHPAYYVSWNDINGPDGFIDRLNAMGVGIFRLPTEAEWEYACRGGTQSRFFFGDSLECDDEEENCATGHLPGNRSDYMWFEWSDGKNGFPCGSKPVASLLPNQYGLYDMSGNVYEWCQDWYHFSYSGAPLDGSAWTDPFESIDHVVRGGHWGEWAQARYCRSAYRGHDWPDNRNINIGFRLVLVDTEPLNRPPSTPDVKVLPSHPYTNDDLVCEATNSIDPDGDAVTYSFQWFEDGTELEEETDFRLSADHTVRDREYTCVVTPHDEEVTGPASQDSVVVLNTPPSAPVIRILPENPTPDDGLAAWIDKESEDLDNDLVVYVFEWYEVTGAGVAHRRPEVSGHAPPYYNPGEPEISSLYTQVAETWQIRVTPYDYPQQKDSILWDTGANGRIMKTAVPGSQASFEVRIRPDLNGDDVVTVEDLLLYKGVHNQTKEEVLPELRPFFFEPDDPMELRVPASFLWDCAGRDWYRQTGG